MNIFGAFCMHSTYLDVNEGVISALPTRETPQETFSDILHLSLYGLRLFVYAVERARVRVVSSVVYWKINCT